MQRPFASAVLRWQQCWRRPARPQQCRCGSTACTEQPPPAALPHQVYLHEADREWVTRPSTALEFWSGEEREVWTGVNLMQVGALPRLPLLHKQPLQQAGPAVHGAVSPLQRVRAFCNRATVAVGSAPFPSSCSHAAAGPPRPRRTCDPPALLPLQLGGHFPGSSVLLWEESRDGQGVVFAGEPAAAAAHVGLPCLLCLASLACAAERCMAQGRCNERKPFKIDLCQWLASGAAPGACRLSEVRQLVPSYCHAPAGDTVFPVPGGGVSFMFSFPNLLPLPVD